MEHPAFEVSNFCFCPPPSSFSAVHPPSFEGHPPVAVRRQRSEIPLIENATAANRRHSLNARASRASGGFRFFAFTSSLLGCISLKTSILRVKVHFHRKPSIFLLFNNLGVKATAFTSTGAEDCRRHDKNGGAECPSPRRCGG